MIDLVERLNEEGLGFGIGPALLCQEAAAEITRLRAALADAQVVGFAAAVEAAAKRCDAIAGNTADFNHYHRRAAGQCGAAIRALTPPDATAAAARVLLDDLALALSTEIGVAGGKEAGRRWVTAHDAAESAPTAMSRATPIQMIRAALRAIAGDTP